MTLLTSSIPTPHLLFSGGSCKMQLVSAGAICFFFAIFPHRKTSYFPFSCVLLCQPVSFWFRRVIQSPAFIRLHPSANYFPCTETLYLRRRVPPSRYSLFFRLMIAPKRHCRRALFTFLYAAVPLTQSL